jgi:hypothetical protein
MNLEDMRVGDVQRIGNTISPKQGLARRGLSRSCWNVYITSTGEDRLFDLGEQKTRSKRNEIGTVRVVSMGEGFAAARQH